MGIGDRERATAAAKNTARWAAHHAPGLRTLLEHRDALVADREQLLAERVALSDRLDASRARYDADIAAAQAEATTVRSQLQDAAAHRDRLAEAAESLAAEKQVLLAQREALETTAHELLRLRNEPRAYLAARFLHGSGIEIGALHRPTPLPAGVTVRYLDRMRADDLRAEYPELQGVTLVDPDLLDDGELLTTVPDASVDFIIANHFLEHCEDPIGTLITHCNRLRPGGVLFYAVPDKRHTFDAPRTITSLPHLVADHADGGASSRFDHYVDYAQLVHHAEDPQALAHRMIGEEYSIHFHVWTNAEVLELLTHVQRNFVTELDIVAAQSFEDECIVVAHKGSVAPTRAGTDSPN